MFRKYHVWLVSKGQSQRHAAGRAAQVNVDPLDYQGFSLYTYTFDIVSFRSSVFMVRIAYNESACRVKLLPSFEKSA